MDLGLHEAPPTALSALRPMTCDLDPARIAEERKLQRVGPKAYAA